MIEVNNLTKSRVSKDFLKNIAQKVLKKENNPKFDLSIVLVGKKKMREINKRYQKKDKATDVLSFNYYGGSGEIVICPEVAGKDIKDLVRVLTHGMLHLLGYSHRAMEKLKSQHGQAKNHHRS